MVFTPVFAHGAERGPPRWGAGWKPAHDQRQVPLVFADEPMNSHIGHHRWHARVGEGERGAFLVVIPALVGGQLVCGGEQRLALGRAFIGRR